MIIISSINIGHLTTADTNLRRRGAKENNIQEIISQDKPPLEPTFPFLPVNVHAHPNTHQQQSHENQ